MVNNKGPYDSIKTFLFYMKSSEKHLKLLDKVRLMTLYVIILGTLMGGVYNCIILFRDKDPFSAFILLGAISFMISGVFLFWWKRNIKIIQIMFFWALMIILTDVILEAGNRYGLGTIYMLTLLSISYLLLNQSYGIFLPVYFFVGMMIRLSLGNYPADSIFNRPDIVSRFTVILGLHVFVVIMASVLIDLIINHLYKLALFDQVSQLPNRIKFMEILEDRKQTNEKHKAGFYVLGIKIVRFGQLSSHISQFKGDIILEETGRRIKQVLPKKAPVSRWSGSLFLAILEDLPEDQLNLMCKELLEFLKLPYTLKKDKFKLNFLVGITRYPEDLDARASLLENILSLFQYKKNQINTLLLYDKEQQKQVVNSYQLQEALKMADLETEFHLLYQPKHSLSDDSCRGAEVLLRWTHPQKGPVSPVEFIPLAEESGMIVQITRWLINRVLKDIQQLKQQIPDLAGESIISINLSIEDLKDLNFSSFLLRAFQDSLVPTSLIEFELTESILIDDDPAITANIEALYSMGFRLSIDDFGTGYSSLSYLQHFHVHSIKIDRSFIQFIQEGKDKRYPVIDAIISMARSLDLEVIAEGVERREQVQYLKEKGCHTAQGWLYNKGLPLSSFIDLALKHLSCQKKE